MQSSKSAIEALWSGELCPGEELPKNTELTQEIIENINKKKEELKKMLNSEQNAILKELLNDFHFLYLLRRYDEFKKGFSLASKLLAEAFYHQ